MALIKCKDCQKDVSTDAAACPHCGAPIAKPAASGGLGCFGWAVAIVGGFIVLGAIGSMLPKSPADIARDDAMMACIKARRAIEVRLRAPSTAEFSNCASQPGVPTGKANEWIAAGYVDSENGFGAKIRSTYSVRVQRISDDDWQTSDIVLN